MCEGDMDDFWTVFSKSLNDSESQEILHEHAEIRSRILSENSGITEIAAGGLAWIEMFHAI